MAARDIRAGGAYIEISIRDGLTQGLRNATAKLRAFAATAGAISASFAVAAKHFADVGSEIHDMSQRTGVAADKLSEFKYAAEQSGASLQDVEKAIRFMQKQGVSADKFEATLNAVAGIADASERAATAMKLWGKSGTALLPMARDIAQLRAEARALGVSMSPQRAAQADDLGDAFGRLKAALSGATMQWASVIAPTMTKFIDMLAFTTVEIGKLADSASDFAAWVESKTKQNASLVGAVLGGAGVWAVAGGQKLRDDFKKRTSRDIPDFTDLSSIIDMRGGSRGTFSGFRAENLAVGSGGGVSEKLDKMNGLLAKIGINTKDTVKAVEDIDQLTFE